MDELKAKEVVAGFIGNAKHVMDSRIESTMYAIGRLPWWKSWRAPQMVQECLGIGPYWNRGFERDTSPKTLREYYWRGFLASIWLD